MRDSRLSIKLVALMLVAVMSFPLFVGCGGVEPEDHTCTFGEWEVVKQPTDTEDGLQERKCECGEKEQKVIEATGIHTCTFGFWEVVKQPTNTEDGLQERKCECGKTEQKIIKASGGEFSIYYYELKNAEYPEQTGYNSADGVLSLIKPTAVGYKFIGWYTKSVGGEIVDNIPKGSTGDYILYARWELINYDITYKNVPNNTNPTTYNIESKLKLETPKWSGLEFTHWSDEDGNKYIPDGNITVLPQNMSGDKTLTANWKVLRNIATPAPEGGKLYNVFSGEEGMLYFHYDLGTIEHVVLDDINPNLYYKSEGMGLDLTLSNTVTISDEKAEAISNTVSQSISNTDSWAESYSKAKTKSDHWNAEVGGGVDAGIGGGTGASLKKLFNWSVKLHVEGSYEWGKENSKTEEWGSSESHSTETSETQSDTVTSSLAYKKEITSEIVENYPISADLPSGYYAYVHAGNVRVVAIVTYEVATGYMYLNTYCRLDNMHSMIMYYPDVNSMNNPTVEGLNFEIPEDKIVNFIENSYYVKYDANGGEGTMPTTIHSIDGTERLATNTFTKEGHTFAGWELVTDDGVKMYLDGQVVTNIGKAHEIVTLKAMWTYEGPVWEEKESGTNYYIKPNDKMGFDKNHELTLKYNNKKLESGVDGNTKIVVTEEKFYTYVYWHWAYRTDKIYDCFIGEYKGEKLPNGKTAQYYRAFESTESYGHVDSTGTKDETCYYHNTKKASDGSWWWFRFEVVVQTYTVYENTNYKD